MAFTISRSKKAPAIAKIETTYGTDPTPTGAANAFHTIDSAVTAAPNVSRIDFNVHGSSFTRPVGQIGARTMGQRFNFMLEGKSGSPGTAHPTGAVLRSCGMAEALSGTISVTYSPQAMVSMESSTIVVEHDGVLHETNGWYGNIRMVAGPRDGIRCSVDGRGLFKEPSQGTIASHTPGVLNAKAFLSVGLTITPLGGSAYTPVLKSWTFNRGIVIEDVEDANSATGINRLLITDADPSIELVVALDTDASANLKYAGTATNAIYENLQNARTHAVAFSHATGSAGNKIAFSGPTLQLVNAAPTPGGGHRNVTLSYAGRHATANSEFSFTIT
jgi:hypothetical protein